MLVFKRNRHLQTLVHTNASAIVVDENVLPALCWRAVRLVHDTKMRMSGGNVIPPVPGFTVQRRMSKSMDILYASEVAACCNAVGLGDYVSVKDSPMIWLEICLP